MISGPDQLWSPPKLTFNAGGRSWPGVQGSQIDFSANIYPICCLTQRIRGNTSRHLP
jgi:hypothetical protein